MGHALAMKDSDRLPWLESYSVPVKAKKGGWGWPLAAGAFGAAIGISAFIVVRDANIPVDQPVPHAQPQASVTIPAPDALKLDVPRMPLKVEPTQSPTRATPDHRTGTSTSSSRRAASRQKARIVTAMPDRMSFESVLSEQIATLPPPAPVIQPAPAPVIPLRPAVNPAAEVVRGKTAQLGVYLSAREAEAAWRSAIKDYTFLVTMKKDISPVRLGKGSRRYYRLQLGTPSRKHAKQLCRNLRQTGRACTVA